ncbi:ABC transporter substrate-binding protein [Desulfofalx alkaliphila]|uniref:ABC transporter substrate-binding protein n=1 Tax=Desulfofalx alkaliphila TaxID=105483 RepID=UPI00054F1B94|nr:ABC transporter substrate-binding protein [Desulfofalx alkaliphila]
MIIKKWLLQLSVLIAFLFLVFSLEQRGVVSTLGPPADNGQELRVVTGQKWLTLDPAAAGDPGSAYIINNIYEGLVRYKPGGLEPEPALATGWQVEDEGRQWIFQLRRGVKFHDGSPFDARAVKFSVDRVMAEKAKAPYSEMVFGMVDKVEVLDDYTVKFVLKQPYGPFLHNLAMPWAAPIVSPTAVKESGADFGRQPAGTGPFKLDKWQENTLVLTANEDYWQKPPRLKRVVFVYQADEEARLKSLAAGEADLADNICHRYNNWAQEQNLKVVQQTGLSINYLGYYTNKEPFSSARIRRAVTMAIDRDKLVNEVYGSAMPKGDSYIPPNVMGHDEAAKQYPYNIAESKRLLSQNGYPKGMSLTLITYRGPRPYNPAGGEQLALAVKEQLEAANIRVEVKSYPWEEYQEALRRQEGDCFLYGWVGDKGDPDNFLYTLLTSPQIERGLNLTRYQNAQIDRVLAGAQQLNDPQLRQRLYHTAQQTLLQESPLVLFNYGIDNAVIRSNIEGFKMQPVGGYYLYYVNKS